MNPEPNKIILYTAPNGDIRVDVYVEDETVWLTQKSMAELFGVAVNTINYHLNEIFKNLELQKDSVIRKIRITAVDGKNYNTNFYNFDAIYHFSHLSCQFVKSHTIPILCKIKNELTNNKHHD